MQETSLSWYDKGMPFDITCEFCGEVTSKTSATNRGRRWRFCSQQCATLSQKSSSNEETRTCLSCSQLFAVAKLSDKKKYCSKSCAAKVNNVVHTKRQKLHPDFICVDCGKTLPYNSTRKGKRCQQCYQRPKMAVRIQSWLDGEWNGSKPSTKYLSTTIRNYLLEEANYACQRCGFDTPHPDDGKTILEINHINGNGEDHRRENLEVICPNCHALTSSYRGRNVGNGRPVFYHRVHRQRKNDLD